MTDIEFFIYILAVVIIILLIIWLFFGGGEYEYQGLNFLDPPKKSTCDIIDSQNDESSDLYELSESSVLPEESYEEIRENTMGSKGLPDPSEEIESNIPDVSVVDSTCEVESSTIATIIKFLPSYDIEYYKNFVLTDEKGLPKRMEKKTAVESRGESICRNILEKFFNKPFPSARPDFLLNSETNRNLELDCYNQELGLALEYNGAQHYDFPNKFHKTLKEFEDQRRRDQLKREVCSSVGIYLITVPYRIPHNKIPKYIEYYLPENVEHRRSNGIDDETEDTFWDEPVIHFPKNGFL